MVSCKRNAYIPHAYFLIIIIIVCGRCTRGYATTKCCWSRFVLPVAVSRIITFFSYSLIINKCNTICMYHGCVLTNCKRILFGIFSVYLSFYFSDDHIDHPNCSRNQLFSMHSQSESVLKASFIEYTTLYCHKNI